MLVVFVAGLDPVCRADHPDREHRPAGKPEEMLSGVYINSNAYRSLRNEEGLPFLKMVSALRLNVFVLGSPVHTWKRLPNTRGS